MDYDRLRELQQKFEENPRRYFAPLANEYRKGGQPRRAIEICRAQLEHMPGHMSGQIVFGQALYEAGEFAEAREVFERALSLDPENLIALRSLGDMSLQAGNTAEARSWYSRLLDADPKDTSVIALISEIDAASDATPVAAEVPGIDTDVGDQQIPAGIEPAPAAEPIPEPALLKTSEMPVFRAPAEQQAAQTEDPAPLGLERHYPVADPSGDVGAAQSAAPEGPTLEDLGVPTASSATEGLTSARQDVNSALDSGDDESWDTGVAEAPSGEAGTRVEGLEATQLAGASEFSDGAASAESQYSDAPASEERDEPVSSSVEEEPAQSAPAHRPAPTEERQVTAASTEPFVNETMAKLYLKQGYNQLALKVYRQLLVSRPDDQSLRDRIREIQAIEAAKHPAEAEVVEARAEVPEPMQASAVPAEAREEEPAEERHVESEPVREPTETRTSDTTAEPDDGFDFGRPAADSPPTYDQERDRESIESPPRYEPREEPREAPREETRIETRIETRAQPAEIAARQPSIREFFATLGRRRPPRPSFGATSRAAPPTPPRPEEQSASDTSQPFGASPPAATLDSVFAGATVSAADARAASRLAGAFSGATGTSRTPPTPPMPTPRLNPRVQAQESEEDVAKFRAWLDGLTGE